MQKAFEEILERLEESAVCEDYGTCNYCQNIWCPRILIEREEVEQIVQEVAAKYEQEKTSSKEN